MKIRVVDYQANPGGGVRFTTELLKGLREIAPALDVEFVSHGRSLQAYGDAFQRRGIDVPLRALAPHRHWRTLPATRLWGLPGSGKIKRLLGYDSQWHYAVPPQALQDCDVVWFPWLHRHRLPEGISRPVVGSFHDAIVFLWPDLVAPRQLRDERRTLASWVAAEAQMVVSSRVTLGAVTEALAIPAARVVLIRVGWTHVKPASLDGAPLPWPWARTSYLLCPANTSPHKNHEVLFAALGRWHDRIPLVLTGYGTDLPRDDARARTLRVLAKREGLALGTSIIPLGFVEDDTYFRLLARAWALVMPSRLEGGGSFPVMEAVLSGIPVLCADIPVLREQMEEVNARVLWFNALDPDDLAAQMEELRRHYGEWAAQARRQARQLRLRTWHDVAEEYRRVLVAAAGGEA